MHVFCVARPEWQVGRSQCATIAWEPVSEGLVWQARFYDIGGEAGGFRSLIALADSAELVLRTHEACREVPRGRSRVLGGGVGCDHSMGASLSDARGLPRGT